MKKPNFRSTNLFRNLCLALLLLQAGLRPSFGQVQQAWVARYNGPGSAYDGAYARGNVYVTGSAGTVKYDSRGNQLWLSIWSRTALAFNATANVWCTTGAGYFTTKNDGNGNHLWDAGYRSQGQSDYAHALALDEAGNVYVTGLSENEYNLQWPR